MWPGQPAIIFATFDAKHQKAQDANGSDAYLSSLSTRFGKFVQVGGPTQQDPRRIFGVKFTSEEPGKVEFRIRTRRARSRLSADGSARRGVRGG